MPKSWYSIKAAAAGADTVEVSIYDEIGYWGVTGASFIADLKGKLSSSVKNINLSINSPGGSVFDGWAIFNALKASGKTITVDILGIAASMASVIAMAGDKIRMPDNAMMMVHNAISGVYGDAADMRDVADVLDKIDNSIVATYVARTGKTEAEVRDLMAADTFMTAAEALELGFATEVTASVQAKATFDTDRLPANVRALFTGQAPAAAPVPSVVALVATACKGAGLEAYVDLFATDVSITTPEALAAAVADAVQVRELCALVGRPGDEATHIRARTSLQDVRAALAKARAENDPPTDSARTATETKGPAGPTAINPTQLWAQVRAMNAAMSGRSN